MCTKFLISILTSVCICMQMVVHGQADVDSAYNEYVRKEGAYRLDKTEPTLFVYSIEDDKYAFGSSIDNREIREMFFMNPTDVYEICVVDQDHYWIIEDERGCRSGEQYVKTTMYNYKPKCTYYSSKEMCDVEDNQIDLVNTDNCFVPEAYRLLANGASRVAYSQCGADYEAKGNGGPFFEKKTLQETPSPTYWDGTSAPTAAGIQPYFSDSPVNVSGTGGIMKNSRMQLFVCAVLGLVYWT